jgi:hypothetical protein
MAEKYLCNCLWHRNDVAKLPLIGDIAITQSIVAELHQKLCLLLSAFWLVAALPE